METSSSIQTKSITSTGLSKLVYELIHILERHQLTRNGTSEPGCAICRIFDVAARISGSKALRQIWQR